MKRMDYGINDSTEFVFLKGIPQDHPSKRKLKEWMKNDSVLKILSREGNLLTVKKYRGRSTEVIDSRFLGGCITSDKIKIGSHYKIMSNDATFMMGNGLNCHIGEIIAVKYSFPSGSCHGIQLGNLSMVKTRIHPADLQDDFTEDEAFLQSL